MSDHYEVVIYGASGYTGKLIAWHMAEDNIPFIAAGRTLSRLEEQMAAVPEAKDHDYKCVQVDHTVDDLAELFKGKKVVYNVVGPFMQLGETVVQACLKAGCHYLDTTGETEWMRLLRDKYSDKFEKAGLLLCPAASYMWAYGAIAAEIAMETPGIDTLDILYYADPDTSVASTKSFLSMSTRPQYYLEHNKLVQWPMATAYDTKSPDAHMTYKALPWSGGGETIWYEHDPRVRNCLTMVALKNRETFGKIHAFLVEFEEKYSHLPIPEQEAITNEVGAQLTTEEPNREHPDINRHLTSCIARSNTGGVNVMLRGNSPYAQTGAMASEFTRRVLTGKIKSFGFTSPPQAFGAREIAACLSERGYLDWTVQAV